MVEFIKANGRVLDDDNDETSFIGFTISGGDSNMCIGDQIWVNSNELEIIDSVSEEDLNEFLENVRPKSKLAIKGVLRRFGVNYD